MNRLLVRSAAFAALAIALSACAMFTPPDTRLMFGMSPTNELGYEVDTSGAITIESRILTFRNPAGMAQASVTGYSIQYRDQAGVLIGQTSTTPQSLNILVPAGYVCTTPDPLLGCSPMSEGAVAAPGMPGMSEEMQSQLLNVGIAQQHITAGFPTGWYADITFVGHRGGLDFQEVYRVNIVAPN